MAKRKVNAGMVRTGQRLANGRLVTQVVTIDGQIRYLHGGPHSYTQVGVADTVWIHDDSRVEQSAPEPPPKTGHTWFVGKGSAG